MKLLKTIWQQHVRGGQLFSPSGFALRAVAIIALFLVCHALGLRQYTTIASGSAAPALGSESVGAALAVVYIACYLGLVIVAPVLLLAAGLFALYRIALSARHGTRQTPAELRPDSPNHSRRTPGA